MSSLPVKNFYQHIGEQVEALPNAVVHIENSVYLRSKGITSDTDSLRKFIDYAIKTSEHYDTYNCADYDLQVKQNNNNVYYGIATFVEARIARDLIEEHPSFFLEQLIYVTSAYLQPRRNTGRGRAKNSPKNATNNRTNVGTTGKWAEKHQFPTKKVSNRPITTASNPVKVNPISPPVSPIQDIQKPVFQADVVDLAARLKKVGVGGFLPMPDFTTKEDSKKDILSFDSLFDSGNSSPDDFPPPQRNPIFQKQISNGSFQKREVLYPFGLCLPDYSRGFKTISRCSSFDEQSKHDDILDHIQRNKFCPKFY